MDEITLRDQLAMAAVTGLVSSLAPDEREETLDGHRGGKRIAKAAYVYADAMLEARKEKTNG